MNERKVWFITRPERDPKFHREALLALEVATRGFKIPWSRNREAHIAFERELGTMGVKRDNVSESGSGGRTWAAMLKTFAYCYVDDEGFLVPTKAGQSIIRGERVFENIKKQILTLQIPNAYFLEPGFRPKFDSEFSIRPARFLIRLVHQSELDYYITKQEITFFVLTAKKDSELEDIVQRIIAFRNASDEEKERIKQAVSEQYEHRERLDSDARDYENAHSDVAHTFMLISEYTGMVEYLRGDALRVHPENSQDVLAELDWYDMRYPFNKRYLISLQRMAESNGLDVERYKASALHKAGVASNQRKLALKIDRLREEYPDLSSLSREQLIDHFRAEMSPREAERVADDVLERTAEYEGVSDRFVEGYLHEENDHVFEDKTGEIFKAIGFDVVMRPKPVADVSTEIEILLRYGDKYCGIIDAKNYKTKFPLSAAFASHMASEYIPNYEGYDGREVHFFGYVTAAGFSGEKNLDKISQLATRSIPGREIRGILLTARALLGFLDYCKDEGLALEERVHLFLRAVKNRGYVAHEALIKP